MSEIAKRARFYNPPLKEQLSRSGEPKEERAARRAIEHFVTDPKASVYAFDPFYVPEFFASLIKARYSRTELSARQLIWREFISARLSIPWGDINRGTRALKTIFDYQRAESLGRRVVLEYGDDSVKELGGAHVFFDRVSQVAAKQIEDSRIGLSPIEKSTRYVVFDQKGPDGDYSFYKDPRIMDDPRYKDIYLDATRNCFDFYAISVEQLQTFLTTGIPIESQQFPDMSVDGNPKVFFENLKDERSIRAARSAYQVSIRSKACDVARVLLPASTLTNIGEFGNARAYEYLMIKLLASPLAESQMVAEELLPQIQKILPVFFDGVNNEYGQSYQRYIQNTEARMKWYADQLFRNQKPYDSERVELVVGWDKLPEVKIAAGLLYPYTNLPLSQILTHLAVRSDSKVEEILHDSLKFRGNRRHKPPRAFEIAGYELLFDIVGNFGIYRDLQRQRVLTQQRQPYTTDHGFDVPLEFYATGLDTEFAKTIDRMQIAHEMVRDDYPLEAQYLTTLANHMRWYMGMNLRECFWVSELRSIPQGHFSYRTVARDMFIKAAEVYPFLQHLRAESDSDGQQQFVDMSDRSQNLERMEAMQRIQVKLAEVEEKYS